MSKEFSGKGVPLLDSEKFVYDNNFFLLQRKFLKFLKLKLAFGKLIFELMIIMKS